MVSCVVLDGKISVVQPWCNLLEICCLVCQGKAVTRRHLNMLQKHPLRAPGYHFPARFSCLQNSAETWHWKRYKHCKKQLLTLGCCWLWCAAEAEPSWIYRFYSHSKAHSTRKQSSSYTANAPEFSDDNVSVPTRLSNC